MNGLNQIESLDSNESTIQTALVKDTKRTYEEV